MPLWAQATSLAGRAAYPSPVPKAKPSFRRLLDQMRDLDSPGYAN